MANPRAASRVADRGRTHPRALAPDNLVLTLLLSAFGAIVGIQILVNLGITPNTSLIGALVAMALARIPLRIFRGYRSIHAQNLAQTSISAATFGAANSLFIPIGIPFLLGLPDMVVPMLVGVSLSMLLDGYLLYRLFDTPAFPAENPWPIGVASAEAIKAGDRGGKEVRTLLAGLAAGAAGAVAGLPVAAFGVALIGGMVAMTAFGLGLLTRGYSEAVLGIDIGAAYIPHGAMIGAGLVALVQVVRSIFRHDGQKGDPAASRRTAVKPADDPRVVGRALRLGGPGYLGIMILLTFGTGIYTGMSPLMLAGFILFGAFSAFAHELIAGIAAMHSGWFPAFATALITLLAGIMLGFPAEALVVLVGFCASTGPAFADMGYDLKTGFILRGHGGDSPFELEGRRQQWIASMIGFGMAVLIVSLCHQMFFSRDMVAPIDEAYVAAIKTGVSADVAIKVAIWAVPGAMLQIIGGARHQVGVLFATGLLIVNAAAGWLVLCGLLCRVVIGRRRGPEARRGIEVFAGGVIAGDALFGFFSGMGKGLMK